MPNIRFMVEIDVDVALLEGDTIVSLVDEIKKDLKNDGDVGTPSPSTYFEDLPAHMTLNRVIKVERVPEGAY